MKNGGLGGYHSQSNRLIPKLAINTDKLKNRV